MKKLLFLLIPLTFVLFITLLTLRHPDSTLVTGLTEKGTPNKSSTVKETTFPISLASIYAANHNWVATLSAQKKTVIIVTGDIIPARSVNKHVVEMGNFKWPYEKTADFLKTADLTFINLETSLLQKCASTDSGMVFCGDSRHIEGLKFAGVDVANLGNNHAGNYGKDGVLETVTLLKQNGIDVVGVTEPLYRNINGTKFAFLGFNDITKVQPGVLNVGEELIKSQIQEARKNADVVIVQYHWGVEYRDLPDDRQIYLGHFTIDQGADLVIGNHPHWVQPIEFYKGKLITYAHGNFIFDQMWSEKTQEGVVGKYLFYGNKLVDVEYFPVRIAPYGQPYFLEGSYKQKILDEMKTNSFKLLKNENQ